MSAIHLSADVHPEARLADDVLIGPFCRVGAGVRLERGVRLTERVSLDGPAEIGPDVEFACGAAAGLAPSAASPRGASLRLVVGPGARIGPATVIYGGEHPHFPTRLGPGCRVGAGVVAAPGCRIGARAELGARAVLGPGAVIDRDAVLGDGVVLAPDAHVGAHARVATGRLAGDAPPYLLADGWPARVRGVDIAELLRRGVPEEDCAALAAAYALALADRVPLDAARTQLRAAGQLTPAVNCLFAFLEERTRPRDRQTLAGRAA